MMAPSSRRNLDAALQRIASGNREGYLRVRSVVANTVVAQMLPDGAVKGGSGLKLRLGLPAPSPVPLMPIPHQIAQKLHALTEPGSHRAHDLIDLQIIEGAEQIDLAKTRNVCARLFAYRKAQPWPSPIVCGDDWPTGYDAQCAGLPVLPTAAEGPPAASRAGNR